MKPRFLPDARLTGLIFGLPGVMTYLNFVEPVRVSSDAMAGTIPDGDKVLVLKLRNVPWGPGSRLPGRNAPWGHQAERRSRPIRTGDLVLRRSPHEQGEKMLQRCVAIGPETVQLRRGVLFVDGVRRTEPWVRTCAPGVPAHRPWPEDFGPVTLRRGEVFLLGDHRDASTDSRDWGPVPEHEIEGFAGIVSWSWDAERKRPRLDRIGRVLLQ